MSDRKPVPEVVERNIKICIVCGKRSYSLSGVHPQCAVRLADAPREKRLKQMAKAKQKPSVLKTSGVVPWYKKKAAEVRPRTA